MSFWPLQHSSSNPNASSDRHFKRDNQEQLWSQPNVQAGNIGGASLLFDTKNKATWRFALDNLGRMQGLVTICSGINWYHRSNFPQTHVFSFI
jgi:hypothetical protein